MEKEAKPARSATMHSGPDIGTERLDILVNEKHCRPMHCRGCGAALGTGHFFYCSTVGRARD
jgi:hypothetical protein